MLGDVAGLGSKLREICAPIAHACEAKTLKLESARIHWLNLGS
jgi:hypothetical protein